MLIKQHRINHTCVGPPPHTQTINQIHINTCAHTVGSAGGSLANPCPPWSSSGHAGWTFDLTWVVNAVLLLPLGLPIDSVFSKLSSQQSQRTAVGPPPSPPPPWTGLGIDLLQSSLIVIQSITAAPKDSVVRRKFSDQNNEHLRELQSNVSRERKTFFIPAGDCGCIYASAAALQANFPNTHSQLTYGILDMEYNQLIH